MAALAMAFVPSLLRATAPEWYAANRGWSLSWVPLMAALIVVFVAHRRLFPPFTLNLRLEERWWKRHNTELTLVATVIAAIAAVVSVVVSIVK